MSESIREQVLTLIKRASELIKQSKELLRRTEEVLERDKMRRVVAEPDDQSNQPTPKTTIDEKVFQASGNSDQDTSIKS